MRQRRFGVARYLLAVVRVDLFARGLEVLEVGAHLEGKTLRAPAEQAEHHPGARAGVEVVGRKRR
jgi:hypothetical protein